MVVFTPEEAEHVDQWITDARGTKRRMVMAILAKDDAMIEQGVALNRMDSALAACTLRVAMLGKAHGKESDENDALKRKVQRWGPWQAVGKGSTVIVLLALILGTIKMIQP